ncbi:hypothetical protein BN1110_02700 [bacterium YEK0313]|nr:hypothetical protein BN1110_02700 [bacterium YEK0313]
MANQDVRSEAGNGQASTAAPMPPVLLTSLMDGQREVWATGQHLVEEGFSFVLRRLDAQREFFSGLADAKDPEALARLNRAFWDRASADYTGEFEEVARSVQGLVERMQPHDRAA